MAAIKAIEIANKAVDSLLAEGTAVHTLLSNLEKVSMAHVSTVELDLNSTKNKFHNAKEFLAHTDLGCEKLKFSLQTARTVVQDQIIDIPGLFAHRITTMQNPDVRPEISLI